MDREFLGSLGVHSLPVKNESTGDRVTLSAVERAVIERIYALDFEILGY
jgi:hypothetical protein